MATVRPFQGIFYDPQRVDMTSVVAPPYDVITPQDQQRYYRQDPRNVVRLIAGEVKPTDHTGDNKYTRAAAFFSDWLGSGVLKREPHPCFYIYRQVFRDPAGGAMRARSGILGVVQLEPFGRGVLAHERTHARPKADRLSLTQAVDANLSPVFALYQDPQAGLRRLVEDAQARDPRLAISTDDGERHEVWCIGGAEPFRTLARGLEASPLFIADGHHRYETALNYRDRQRTRFPDASAEAAFNYVLMLLVDAHDPNLVILPTHRILRDLEGFDGVSLLTRLSTAHTVRTVSGRPAFLKRLQERTEAHRLGIVLPEHRFAILDVAHRPSSDRVAELDVSVLHRVVFAAELGLQEGSPESERHLAYTRNADIVLDDVEQGRAQAGFLLHPPAVADVLAVAREGRVMPQKTTYFYPKPLSGIVFNPLDPSIRIAAG
jgi:uncharacterized protein (DUF1015 family)